MEEIKDKDLAEVSGGVEGNFFRYTIQPDDTLLKIAEKYGTTVDYLCAVNKIADPNMIIAGTTILVPFNPFA